MYSNEHIENYLNKCLDVMEEKFLRRSNIYKYAMIKYNKCCVFSISKKMYRDTKREMRIIRLKEILINLYHNKFDPIPTAKLYKF